MRKTLHLTLLLTLSVFASALCNAEVAEKGANPPAKFEQGVVVGNRVIGVDNRGHLVSYDFAWGTNRDYGTLERKLGPHIDVARDKACVLSEKEVCEVDLASGKIVRSAKQTTGIGGVGFIDANRVFTHNGHSLEVIDLATGKTLHKIDLGSGRRIANWVNGKPLIAHSRSGNVLYVARPFQRDVAVVDLIRGELLKEIKTTDFGWATDVHVAGNKLFVRQMMVSYGFVQEQLSVVELATGQCQQLQFPNRSGDREPRLFRPDSTTTNMEIISSNDGGFLIAAQEGVYRYNANGQLIGESPLALQGGKRLVAVRDGAALVADANSVRKIELSPVKIVAK